LDGTTITVNTSKFKTLTHAFPIEMKINTRNILFVGAGAFEKVKPTELAIELQGRMPIQAKMEALTREDFIKILRDTDNNLLLQTIELLKTEGVNVVFDGAS
jgi:ATP-dependent HslUV protease ATP-binding subunit HslU